MLFRSAFEEEEKKSEVKVQPEVIKPPKDDDVFKPRILKPVENDSDV